MYKLLIVLLIALAVTGCSEKPTANSENKPSAFKWENATVYFLLTDRFYNGNPENDISYDRKPDGALLRSFMGGDLQGIRMKIEEGYFDDLGVDAIWFNPPVEQIHSYVDEGTGKTYGYHGYWARDWTAIDPNFGTMEDLKDLVRVAHEHGIRILMDVVVNHTGPVTPEDSQWPDDWVRTTPQCTYRDAASTIACTLVENLPDLRTDSDEEVELPDFLIEKWTEEGRLEQELAELDVFFERTGYPRAPRFYVMKWLTDYVREMGIDGYRVDTAKHTEASIWADLYKLASEAFRDWKSASPAEVLDDQDFFMMGEVYGYSIQNGQNYFYNAEDSVNFFRNGFKSLINFSMKEDAGRQPEAVFSYYAHQLNTSLKGYSVLNYVSSHDDGGPFDRERTKTYLAGTMLMLTPGQAQIYYGDETARPLLAEGAAGDANLRTMMNWGDLNDQETQDLLSHWQKLGKFRQEHVAIGAGKHQLLKDTPYTFSRTYSGADTSDRVIVVMDNDGGAVTTGGIFTDGEVVTNYYTGETSEVSNGEVSFEMGKGLLLIGKRP
ncbi:alpha-amylase family glycosyl hydrolase [Marinoscillum sp.]|uniref:alpha-amylase family glycosyl hydrolase n=1 Tax=Marinoscillum sp. TaxID=2024838 RepID=UPI003BA9A57E